MTFKRCLGSLLNFLRNNEYAYNRKQKRNLSTMLNNLQTTLALPMALPEIATVNYRLPKNFPHLEMNTEMKRLGMLKSLMKDSDFSSLNLVPARKYNTTCVQAGDLGYVNNKKMIMNKANYENCKLVSYLRDNRGEQTPADNLSTLIAARDVKSLPFMDAKLTGMKQQLSHGDECLREHDVPLNSVEKYNHTSKISGTEVNAVRGEMQQKNASGFNGLPYSGNFAKRGSFNNRLSSLSCGPRRMFSSRSYVIAQKWPRMIGISRQDSNNANVSIPRFRSTQSYTGITKFYRFSFCFSYLQLFSGSRALDYYLMLTRYYRLQNAYLFSLQ
jgi:hypothetical protein